MRYEYKIKPKKCPVCGSTKIAKILYGYLAYSKKLENDLKTEKVVLGGCLITGDDPSWRCLDYNTVIYKKREKKKK